MRLTFVAFIAATSPIAISTAEPSFSSANTSQQSPAHKQAQFYLESYAKQLAPFTEVRFAYSGYTTRSTPSEGLVAKWESSGDFRVSVARKSFHCTSSAKLAKLTKEPDLPPQDLEVEECLVTPDTCLELGGFLAKSDELQIRALFDPVGHQALKRIEASRPAAKAPADGVDGVNKATLTILEVWYAGALPRAIRLKVSLRLNGGVVKRSELPPGVALAGNPESITIEPQTYHYDFKIDNIVYQEEPGNSWFTLDHAIPDGSSVIVDGDYRNVYEWRDGKVGETPVGEIAE